MSLFSRKNPYEKEALDLEAAMRSAPELSDPRPRPTAQPPIATPKAPSLLPAAPTPPPVAAPTLAPKVATYGIEDAIKLMRELPDNKKEMVIAIVQKTMLSAKINVATIIDDAGRKIDRLERKNEKLSQEIRELEEAILQRKMEMESNMRDVEETREVKISFESTQRPAREETYTPGPYIPSQKAG